MFLGMLLFIKVWWLIVIATLSYVLYYERIIMTEEKFLLGKFGPVYESWADKTPAVTPSFRLWKLSDRGFSLKIALRREYNGFYLIIATFYLLEWYDRLLFNRLQLAAMSVNQAPGIYWNSFFIIGTFIFLVFRTLKNTLIF